MSQNPSDVEMSWQQHGPAKPPKGWFGRNWLWFVPTIILLPLLCCCGGGGLLIWYGIGQFKEMPPFKDSVIAAEQDPRVQQALGSNITAMGFIEAAQAGKELQFNTSTNNLATEVDMSIPIKGSAGTGMLIVEAQSTDGVTWTYTVREVQIDATGEVIDLVNSTSVDPASPDDAGQTP